MRIETHAEFSKICRNIGWKCTSQRLAVYEFLQGNPSHPDVDTVWTAVRRILPTITRESVYRILNEYSEAGLIGRLDHIDNARYDSRVGAHGHFICEKCGRISDFDWPEGAAIPQELAAQASHMEIRLVGRCESCSSAMQPDVPTGGDPGHPASEVL